MLQLITTDCLPWMQKQPDNSVQLSFFSPPYENARSYDIGFDKTGMDWVHWMADIICEAVRITDGLVACVCEGRTKKYAYSATPALLMAELFHRGITLRKPPIFHRVGIPGSGSYDWLRNDYEFIVCATSGGRLPWSDNTAMGHPPKWAPGGEMSHRLSDGTRRNQWGASEKSGRERRPNGKRQNWKRPSHQYTTKAATCGNSNGDKITELKYAPPKKANPGNVIQHTYTTREVAELIGEPSDVIKCNVGGGQMGHKLAHENEAPFPETLAEFFIKSFCPPGGIVFDPFSGSGTTAAVALKNGRGAIGIDVRKSQTQLAMQRIRESVPRFRPASQIQKKASST